MTNQEIIDLAAAFDLITFGPQDLVMFAREIEARAAAVMKERCAKVCEELGDHWSAYKDTALLNGDIELSNAASGESRAAEAIATVIRALGDEE